MDLCFTSELGEILNYTGFLVNWIDNPRVRLKVWKYVTFRGFGFMTGLLYCWLYIAVLFS